MTRWFSSTLFVALAVSVCLAKGPSHRHFSRRTTVLGGEDRDHPLMQ